jgi:AcrR family transcriptional regulator
MDELDQIALPESVARMWGLRQRARRGPRPDLTVERIVDAAIQVAGEGGLALVSMSRVADELGVSTMSLYRHVASKDELLLLMVDGAYGAPPAPFGDNEGWRIGIERWARQELAVLQQHPWIVQIPINGPPLTPNGVGWFERGVACLHGTGLAEDEKLGAILLVTGFVRIIAVFMADVLAAAATIGLSPQEASSAYGRQLASLIDVERYPALSAAIAAGAFEQPYDSDADFVFGLERVLDGIDVLIRQRAGQTR